MLGSLSVLLLITPGRWPSSSSSPVTLNWACCYLKAYDVKENRSDIFLPDKILNERWLVYCIRFTVEAVSFIVAFLFVQAKCFYEVVLVCSLV